MKWVKAAGAVVCALVLVVFTVCPVLPWTMGQVVAAERADRFVQVVAHADDDLLFMSPDLFGAVAGGRVTTTIYLTAGEGPTGVEDDRDPRAYVRDRQEGIKAAYAYLAGVPNVWRSRVLSLGRLPVRVDTLAASPRIRLVFAGLPDGGDPRADGGHDALARMWARDACVRRFTGPCPHPCVRRQDVLDTLRALYQRYRPTVLRTLDPNPPDWHGDHTDHTTSAKFAAEAARGMKLKLLAYRGYTMTGWPSNLDWRARRLKEAAFQVYRRHDYRAESGPRYAAWLKRMYLVRPGVFGP
ncbi:PIG-L family deacetylase [Nonomuraea endophytica]|uniref:LmbE family N-acetylglucosaminyl deacetylase n=1 Tax=Nonomuraea endophytica TaxID=714136 RepID=A0A7W8EFE3_9ACTN|nr:PIG-L family deacetylase [Nonomuraea endophytica]MBB5077246.1 LmbE family N-acetylglucosaminyl deacetylase [Nonomuraea endophytica]